MYFRLFNILVKYVRNIIKGFISLIIQMVDPAYNDLLLIRDLRQLIQVLRHNDRSVIGASYKAFDAKQ